MGKEIMKKLIKLFAAVLLITASTNSFAWWGNNGWGGWNDWPVWTPMYWMEEMFEDDYYGGPWGGYGPYGYGGYPGYGYGGYPGYGYGGYPGYGYGGYPGYGYGGYPGYGYGGYYPY